MITDDRQLTAASRATYNDRVFKIITINGRKFL